MHSLRTSVWLRLCVLRSHIPDAETKSVFYYGWGLDWAALIPTDTRGRNKCPPHLPLMFSLFLREGWRRLSSPTSLILQPQEITSEDVSYTVNINKIFLINWFSALKYYFQFLSIFFFYFLVWRGMILIWLSQYQQRNKIKMAAIHFWSAVVLSTQYSVSTVYFLLFLLLPHTTWNVVNSNK